MDQSERIQVTGKDGVLGWIETSQLAQGQDAIIHLENGRLALVPARLLENRADGGFYLSLNRADLDHSAGGHSGRPTVASQSLESETLAVIPLAEEELHLDREVHERTVRIHKTVSARTERVEDAGFTEEIEVERIPVNRQVDQAPVVRSEGDTTVIPLVEEVLVVEKRLMVREEVRITVRRTPHEPIEVTLRTEELDVERPEGRGEL